jgi:hypothetical protein
MNDFDSRWRKFWQALTASTRKDQGPLEWADEDMGRADEDMGCYPGKWGGGEAERPPR